MSVKNWVFKFLIFYLLFTGYVGAYICRTNLTVITQLIIGKFPTVNKETFGQMLTMGKF